jgi:hypothetical protein
MKITIKADFDDYPDQQNMTLTDEGLDNYNFVEIILEKDKGNDEFDYEQFTVSVEDLYRAIELFNKVRLEHK